MLSLDFGISFAKPARLVDIDNYDYETAATNLHVEAPNIKHPFFRIS